MLPKANNFDLIRLFAASQVAVHHSAVHLGIERTGSVLWALSELFPGVPVFFFISGFLISRSYQRNSDVYEYALNRLLRIYPALIVCFAVSLLSVYLLGYFQQVEVSALALMRWTAAQLSIGQFYNPEFLRGYGVGVLNGSLWTITVELQFYVLVPLTYVLLLNSIRTEPLKSATLIGLILVFLIINRVHVALVTEYGDVLWYKLVGVSFAPWVYMFLVGVLCQRHAELAHRLLANRFIPVAVVYCALALAAREYLDWSFGNRLNPIVFAGLAAVAFSAAFTANGLSDRLLRRNDISYGVYIYHMPVINGLLVAGYAGAPEVLAAAMAITGLLAYASWRVVEKPALRLKRHAIYQHVSPSKSGVGTATGARHGGE